MTVWIGLIGTVLGAAASTIAQVMLSHLSRKRRLTDYRVDAAADLVSSIEGIMTEYRMLAFVLDLGKPESAKTLFERGLEAWGKFHHARARVGVICSAEVNRVSEEVYAVVNTWVDNIDRHFFGCGTGKGHKQQGQDVNNAIRSLIRVAAEESEREKHLSDHSRRRIKMISRGRQYDVND